MAKLNYSHYSLMPVLNYSAEQSHTLSLYPDTAEVKNMKARAWTLDSDPHPILIKVLYCALINDWLQLLLLNRLQLFINKIQNPVISISIYDDNEND